MSRLDKLDNYYNSRKPTEAWFMVLLAAGILGYIIHLLVYPTAESAKKSAENKNKQLKKDKLSAERYLRSISGPTGTDRTYLVRKKDAIITNKENQVNDYRTKLAKIKGSFNQMNSIMYNHGNWSKFLDKIALDAKGNGLKVFEISNKNYDQNGTFGKVLDVNIKCKGKYSNILLFMNDLETTELVSNVSYATIKVAPKNPVADINLTVWGIRP